MSLEEKAEYLHNSHCREHEPDCEMERDILLVLREARAQALEDAANMAQAQYNDAGIWTNFPDWLRARAAAERNSKEMK